jgi:DNA repair exonuclease SbcCD ATPase subunit
MSKRPPFFLRLELENCATVITADIDLARYSLVSIVGVVDSDSRKSNGSGKSTLAEAILVAWFGEGKYDIFEYINELADECTIALTWQQEVGGVMTKYKVVRKAIRSKRTHKRELFINDSKTPFGGGKTETDKHIVRILGADKDTLLATNFFAQKKDDAFAAAKPSQRQEYLRTILDTSLWDEAQEYVNALLRTSREKEASLTSTIEALTKEAAAFNVDFKAALKEATDNLKKCDDALAQYEKDTAVLRKELGALDMAETALQSTTRLAQNIADQIGRQTSLKLANERDVASLRDSIARLAKKEAELKTLALTPVNTAGLEASRKRQHDLALEHGAATNELSRIKSDEIRIAKLGATCTGCNRPVDASYKEAQLSTLGIAKVRAESAVKTLEDSMRGIEADIVAIENTCRVNATIQRSIDTLTAEISGKADVEARLVAAQQAAAAVATELTRLHDEHAKITAELEQMPQADIPKRQRLNDQVSELERNMGQAKSVKSQYNEYIGSLKAQQQRVNGITKEIAAHQKEIVDLRAESAVYYTLADAYSKNGVQALIVDSALPTLQEGSNAILRSLGIHRSIELKSTRERLKGGTVETLDIVVHNHTTGKSRSYDTYSGGEATFLNLAMRKSLSDLLAQRSYRRLPFLVMDEVYAALDPDARQKALELLNMLSQEFAQILVTSHTDLASAFPDVLTAVKEGDTTTYIQ